MADKTEKICLSTEDQDSLFLKCVKAAADMTHTLSLAKQKVKRAERAVSEKNKEVKWAVLQEYLCEYASFVNLFTRLTGIYARPVDVQYYEDITLEQLDQQLRTIVGFVYLKESLSSAGKKAFVDCLKKLLKKNGFKEEQLKEL